MEEAIDPEVPKKKVAVLRHADADGFGASWAIHKALKNTCELLFIPVQYGQEPPYEVLADFGPEKLFIVDFSYKAPDLITLNAIYPDMTVVDHHVTALPELQAWLPNESVNPGAGSYFFDETLSGCGLTWNLFHLEEDWDGYGDFHPSAPMPEILQYVQDRDLWRFNLENSKEINAYIATLPEDFREWDDFYLPEAYTAGRAILAFQKRQIEGRVKAAEMVKFDASEVRGAVGKIFNRKDALGVLPAVPFVNCTENISEVGEALCLAYPDAPFSVTYADRPGGKRSYSLRSNNGFDVSAVAKALGGGGHRGASGLTLNAPEII